jgi:hypothetical protein
MYAIIVAPGVESTDALLGGAAMPGITIAQPHFSQQKDRPCSSALTVTVPWQLGFGHLTAEVMT